MFDDFDQAAKRLFLRRLLVYGSTIGALFFILALRLYYLQVVRGPVFRMRSEENRVSQKRVRAPRGNIFDRYGNILATNRPSFSVNVVLENVKNRTGTVEMLSKVLAMPGEEIEKKLAKIKSYRRFEPVRIKEDVSRRVMAVLEAGRYEWPGVQIEVEPRRSYPHGKLAAHILGYVGQINQTELDRRKSEGYRIGDYIGKKGIEKELDGELKGVDGVARLEVDSFGREVRVLASREPRPGNNVYLTIDLGLQQITEKVMAGNVGAIAIVDPKNGEVLAAVSSPAVDPNKFISGFSRAEWAAMESDATHPLQNRTLQAQYPPGSIFKIVTAVAAIEKGVVSEETTFICRGSFYYGDRSYGCWKKGGHGEVNLHRALVESCDVYFYQVGIKVGIDYISKVSREFGLGKKTGILLGGEASGLAPSRAWKKRARGEQWFPGETVSVSIGQGYNLVTPLQAAAMTSVLANDGTLYRPELLISINTPDGETVVRTSEKESRPVAVSARSLRLVKKALRGVVIEQRGTGKAAAVDGLDVSGKTGTAQVVKLVKEEDGKGERDVPRRFRDHAWFVCYATSPSGTVAIAVLVEHGGHGGSTSAPLAGSILREMKNLGYFRFQAVPGNDA